MRKYLHYAIGFALAFVLGSAVLVGAQNVNKALQLSQDPTGSFGVDTNNHVYFPGHILTAGPTTAPVLTGCGTSPTIVGTDTGGIITEGTANTGCYVAFNKTYVSTPYCLVASQSANTASLISWSATAGALTISHGAQGAILLNYICTGSGR